MQLYLFFGLLFAFLVAVFAVQNANPVDIDFLFWRLQGISLSLVLLGSVFAGALIALVLGLARQFRLSRRIRELTAKLAEYEMAAKSASGQAAGSGGGEAGAKGHTGPGGVDKGDARPADNPAPSRPSAGIKADPGN